MINHNVLTVLLYLNKKSVKLVTEVEDTGIFKEISAFKIRNYIVNRNYIVLTRPCGLEDSRS